MQGSVSWNEVARRTLTILGLWALFLAFVLNQLYAGMMSLGGGWPTWAEDCAIVLLRFLPWMPLTAVMLYAAARLPLSERPLRNGALLVALIAALACVRTGISTIATATGLSVSPRAPLTLEQYRSNLVAYGHAEFLNAVFYGAVLTLFETYRFAAARSRSESMLQARLAQAELRYLRVQLHPHFLFNALNAVTTLIQKDARKAELTLGHLSDLLRRALDSSETQLVTIAREIEFLERYIAIQHIRYGERLRIAIDVEPAVREVLIPSMILQPLVENAIRHSIARREGGAIAVTARRDGDDVLVRVVDDGEGIRDLESESSGIGIANVRSRLEYLFGERASVRIDNVPSAFAVEIAIAREAA